MSLKLRGLNRLILAQKEWSGYVSSRKNSVVNDIVIIPTLSCMKKMSILVIFGIYIIITMILQLILIIKCENPFMRS